MAERVRRADTGPLKLCDDCNGYGEVGCEACEHLDGQGYDPFAPFTPPCSECDGEEVVTCGKCHGTGKILDERARDALRDQTTHDGHEGVISV